MDSPSALTSIPNTTEFRIMIMDSHQWLRVHVFPVRSHIFTLQCIQCADMLISVSVLKYKCK